MKRIFAVCLTFCFLFIISLPCEALESSAAGAVLINGATGNIIWSKNPHKKLPMASTTKIMTALLLCENADLDRTIVATEEMVTVEGSSMGLLPGDTVSYRDLLYGMMLASGNDAANTTAIALAGSTEKFAAMMNEKAKEIGMVNTNFVTPSGLDDENHYSTAYDMALLACYALKNDEFAAAACSKSMTLCYGTPPYKRTLSNHNKLLKSYEGVIGVKTGYTKKSGRCLVSAAKSSSSFLIAVTLNCSDDWSEHTALLDYGFSKLKERTADAGAGESISVVGGNKQSVKIGCGQLTFSLTDEEWATVSKKVYMPRFVYATVEKGDVLGRIEYLCGDRLLASCNVTALESAQMTTYNENKFLEYLIMLFKAMM